MSDIIKIATQIIRNEVEKAGYHILRIILFGSRAKKQEHPDSDWDFFVIIDREIDRETKWDVILKIKRQLSKLKVPNDIIIEPLSQIEQKKEDISSISYYAIREGITL